MRGFYGKLLRVNLSGQDYRVEDIPAEILERFLGGKGLGSYLLFKNVRPETDPLSPDNCLIFTTGPACDTPLLGASRYGVYSKSPLTGGYAESYSGGKVGPAIKRTGYDAIIIQGAASNPVFLEISDEGVKFHDATSLWGQDTYATEDAVLEKVQFPGAQALVIGPAGENLVRFACLENNYWRSAGRTGMGAVMGSKKLKAIVFHGRAQCPVADEDLLRQCVSDIRAKAKDNKGVEAYQRYGTPVMVALMNSVRAFPTRYWSEGMFSQWEKVSGDYLRANYEVKSRACPRCLLACGKLTTVKDGPRRGLQVEGPEYETIYSFGGLCCIDNMDEILHLNDLCDRLGLDTITTGNLIALTMEATEQGKLKEQIRYGDAEAAARLVKQIAFRQGLGDVLAEGIVRASRELGMQDVAVHVKGLEPAGYDPRVLKGMALGYATSARGACHLRATFYKAELSGIIDPDTIEGKAELYCDWEDRLTIFNTMIFCVFFRDLIQWEDLIPVVKATTGLELSRDELRRKANDIITLTRLFNWENGFRRKDDALPKRLLTEPVKPSGKQISEEQFNRMLDDYYRIRGWDEEGKPVNFRL